jgi:DNA-binding SARP family transcriptional activator/DNA-binding beta-propeller fold protein YncE
LRPNEVVPTDRIIHELWGESPPESAANMVQGYVSHLRKTLEPGGARRSGELLAFRSPGYVLHVRPEQVDAARFERLAGEGRSALDDGDAAAAAETLREALSLWRGPALADLAYESFARAEAERLEERRLGALEDRIDADLQLGPKETLVGELRELVAGHPLRERLRAQLMAALYGCGRQAEALEVYRDGRRVLRDELGIDPGPALRELEQAILRQDPTLGAARAPWLPRLGGTRRRWPLLAAASVAAAAALVAGLAFGRSSGGRTVAVVPDSVAVIDPRANAVVGDIAVGAYPGPLAAAGDSVYVGNIGDATFSRIVADRRKVAETSSLSRAIDLAAVNGHLWAADGGFVGHTLAPPGTVLDYETASAASRMIRLGPSVEGDEEQTTIAASPEGDEIWAGNKDRKTIVQLEPPTSVEVRGITPGGLAVARASGRRAVWASDPARDLVVRIEPSGRVSRRIAIPREPTRIAVGGGVWVVTRDHNGPNEWRPTRGTKPGVWRIDPDTNEAARIPLPLTPLRIALGAGAVWVTAQRVTSYSGASVDATVFRIDPATNRITARIPLHTQAADGIVVSHGLVWVAVPPSQ